MNFQYQKLSSDTKRIRLLDILSRDDFGQSQYTIREVDLDHPPPYTALSYAWGDPQKCRSILVDGRKLDIADNLSIALEHINPKKSLRLFWIDAVCINQEDAEERQSQIIQMEKIYSQAQEVLIWLGPESNKSKSAMDLASIISTQWPSEQVHLANMELRFKELSNDDILALLGRISDVNIHALLEAMRKLLLRTWFERVWTIQEAAAPVERKTVQCGTETLSWSAFNTAVRFFSHIANRPDLRSSLPTVQTFNMLSIRGLLNLEQVEMRIRDKSKKYRADLLSTLANYRHYNASDPRDKVYALLGLVTEHDYNAIRPDYTIGYPELYLKVAKYFVERHRSLELLGYCSPALKDKTLPSWVPDWVNVGVHHPFPVYSQHRTDLVDPSLHPKLVYSACGTKPLQTLPDYFPVTEDKKLVVQGYRIGKIKCKSPANTRSDNHSDHHSDSSNNFLMNWEPGLLDAPYKYTQESILDALNHTLVADIAKEGRTRTRGYKLDYHFWRRYNDLSIPPVSLEWRDLRKQWGSLMYATMGRSVLWTDEGHLCLGPGDTEVGDWVCLVMGGYVFYVLRERKGRLELVGECYVHGLMDGEVLDSVKHGKWELQRLEIE